MSTQLLSNVKNLWTYRKGSQKEKISTFSCRATKTSFRKILYWQKNQAKKFIFPSVWSCWFATLLSGATATFLDHVLSTSKRSIYPKLNGLHYQDLWPRYYYGIQCDLLPILGFPNNRKLYHHGNNEQSIKNERFIKIKWDDVCLWPIYFCQGRGDKMEGSF